MGSYLSVHNNTTDSYSVKVGVDQAALRVLSIMGLVIGIVTPILAAVALPALSMGVAAAGALVVQGVTAAHIVAITSAVAAIKGISIAATVGGLATALSVLVAEALEDEGYVLIQSNKQHKFGRYTLSLWRQAECIRARPNPTKENQVIVDTVFMRPIFSGATNNSTIVHDIRFWINKWGHENATIIEINENATRSSIDVAIEQFKDVDWMKVFEEARVKAKHELLEKEGIEPQEHYA